MNIRGALKFTSVLLLSGFLEAQEETSFFQIDEWRIGMSEAEALAVESSGGSPQKDDKVGRTDGGVVYLVPNSVEYFNVKGDLRVTILSGEVIDLRFTFKIPSRSPESLSTITTFVEEVAGLIDLRERIEFKRAAKYSIYEAFQLNETSSASVPGYTFTLISVESGIVGHFNVSPKIKFRTPRPSPGVTSNETAPPSEMTSTPGTTIPPGMPPRPGLIPTPGGGFRLPTEAERGNSYQVNGADGRTFKRSLGTINALLVRPLEDGKNAASAMKLTVTAIGERSDGVVDFGFNQEVGEDMQRANQEVVRAVMLRNGGFPPNMNVRFGFADKWGGKDGPSAAVACALLLESLIHGFEIPVQLAVTGDLNADSTVQPVGGVADKIRGAMEANCTLIGVPASNEEDVTDLVVEENLRRFLTAKVFTLGKLDDAILLADPSRMSEEARKAFADLEAVQKDLAVQGAALFSPEMQQRLTSIHAALPNCYTAKILAAAGRRSLPVRYSLVGSLMRIDEAMSPFAGFLAKIKEEKSIDEFRLTRENPMQEAKNRLNALRSKSDERLVAVIDAQKAVVDQFQRFVSADIGSKTVFDSHIKELEKADGRAEEAWKKVKENREIQDQFMKRGISL